MKYEAFRGTEGALTIASLILLAALSPACSDVLDAGAPAAATDGSDRGFGQAPAPPEARRVDVVDVHHGVEVPDPYRWLEEQQSAETLAFVRAQQERAEAILEADPRFDEYRRRFLELQREPSLSWLGKAGDRIFYFRGTAGSGGRPVLVVRDASGGERTLVDPEARWPDGTLRPQGYVPSRDGSHVAVSVGHGPGTSARLRIVEVATGGLLDDVIDELPRTVTVAWHGDGFYYTAYPVPEGGTVEDTEYRNMRVRYHRLGTPPAEDRDVFALPEHPEWSLSIGKTHDGEALVITAAEARRRVNHLYVIELGDGEGEPRELPLPGESTWSYVDDVDGGFVLQTRLDAPFGRVLTVDADTGDAAVLVPERPHTLLRLQRTGPRYLATYVVDARRQMEVLELDGTPVGEVEISGIGGLSSAARADDPVALVRTSSVIDPGTVWEVDVRTGGAELLMRPELSFDPDAFLVEQAFATSADGTRVPLSMVRRRDLRPDGNHPVFMYGYGAWGWSAFPYFQAQWLMWVESGGIFVVPNIRGGGEYGEDWHRAGIKENKQNAVDDYVAAAEWLVQAGWTSPGRIVANGGSASGLLAAAAGAVQRPDLFGGAVIDHPGLDLIRSQAMPGGHFLVPEYGSVEDPEEFRALLELSPYHQLEPGTCYPPVLVTVGGADRTTAPMHGYKFIAALQHAQGCDNPALLQWIPDGGHLVFGNTPEEEAATLARQLVFARQAAEAADGVAVPQAGAR